MVTNGDNSFGPVRDLALHSLKIFVGPPRVLVGHQLSCGERLFLSRGHWVLKQKCVGLLVRNFCGPQSSEVLGNAGSLTVNICLSMFIFKIFGTSELLQSVADLRAHNDQLETRILTCLHLQGWQRDWTELPPQRV